MTYCYYSWDLLYQMVAQISKLNTSSSKLIPLILALGNHDAGYDSMNRQKAKPSNRGPWWFAYNPQHLDSDGKSILPIKNSKGYGYHLIGSTVLVNVDSGYMETYQSQG
jgi:hypothetical protein